MKILLLLLLLPAVTFGQSYDASLIPDSLKTEADEVIRDEQLSLVVSTPAKATFKFHEVFTVLDERGRAALMFATYATSFVKLDNAEINVYDAKGALIQHIRQKQMAQSGYGEGLIEDGMATYYSVTAPSWPITVEIDYTQTYKGLSSYPDFYLSNTRKAIQNARYTLTAPKAMKIRYQDHLLRLEPQITDAGPDNRTYTWKVSGVRAVHMETNAPSDAVPREYIAPTTFELGGLAGDMSTWTSFGKWVYELNKSNYTLPEASQRLYRDMVKGAATDLDKARILYRYLQQNFRYVAIELGIGGQRSFPASFTEDKKYGDCKGLSTYLCACLNAVGVKSYTALINAGYGVQPLDPSFPRNGFNHEILCIPQPHDSVWLECTSKRTDFGILGGFTENRNALLITENGGVLVHTPKATPGENATHTYAEVTLADDGSGKALVTRETRGDYKFGELSSLHEADRDAQKRYIVESLDFPNPADFSVRLEEPRDSPLLRTYLELTYDKVPEFTAGTKMFLNPHLTHLWRGSFPAAGHRTQDYCFNYPFTMTDTTCYILPPGFAPEALPKGKSFACFYASYVSNCWFDPTRRALFCSGVLELHARVIPAIDFAELRRFFGKVIEDETEKIVVNKS
jgi:transglutaminase-like putative cysteine protease